MPKKKSAYQMPKRLPSGEKLEDLNKKKWVLGPSIGSGGFGLIYSAKEYSASSSSKFPYVIKIEPHANGPLFVEMHFYMRNAKPDDVEAFKLSKKLQHLGMPYYISSGSHQHNDLKYRFLVMKKFGSDIWKLLLKNDRKFPPATVYKLGVQLLDVLEYIHSKGYIHADIKGANILLDSESNNVYLVDFGLASHYTSVLKPDPKKAHNGTIEYTSRDAHLGVQTRRGDLEILAYNLLQWLGCKLPWEGITDPKEVQKYKVEFMNDINVGLKNCFETDNVPRAIENVFKFVTSLDVAEEPNYEKLKNILLDGIKSEGSKLNAPLEFKGKKTPVKRKQSNTETPKTKSKTNSKPSSNPMKKSKIKDSEVTNDSQEDNLNSSQILTQEMKRLKEKIELKKTKVTKKIKDDEILTNGKSGSTRVLRKRKD